ncbi:MAG: RNA 2',3'-cyclic phosphodiesterase [Spirochaetales bacterium]|nr:RNA 2',3'-cyclic phosphodiesterase [Spirochaetales bacterium]
MIRCFTGLTAAPINLDSLYQALSPARDRLPHLRWLSPDALHLTLRFFGNLDETQVDRARAALSTLEGQKPITLTFDRWKFLPFPNKARVLVLVPQPSPLPALEALHSLKRAYDQALTSAGLPLPPEKPGDTPEGFLPHVTIARFNPKNRPSTQDLKDLPLPFTLTLDRVILYQSLEGLRYLPLGHVDLGK